MIKQDKSNFDELIAAKIESADMIFADYLKFLDDYWSLFATDFAPREFDERVYRDMRL